jgi:hypothetical protein
LAVARSESVACPKRALMETSDIFRASRSGRPHAIGRTGRRRAVALRRNWSNELNLRFRWLPKAGHRTAAGRQFIFPLQPRARDKGRRSGTRRPRAPKGPSVETSPAFAGSSKREIIERSTVPMSSRGLRARRRKVGFCYQPPCGCRGWHRHPARDRSRCLSRHVLSSVSDC